MRDSQMLGRVKSLERVKVTEEGSIFEKDHDIERVVEGNGY